MTANREWMIVNEIQQLRMLESHLQFRWANLNRERNDLPASFLSSLRRLEARVTRLEILLDGSTPEWRRVA